MKEREFIRLLSAQSSGLRANLKSINKRLAEVIRLAPEIIVANSTPIIEGK